jgi:hypothetical protein
VVAEPVVAEPAGRIADESTTEVPAVAASETRPVRRLSLPRPLVRSGSGTSTGPDTSASSD